jgi:hypothetical protein
VSVFGERWGASTVTPRPIEGDPRVPSGVVFSLWYPSYGHPGGVCERPWFRVCDGLGYRTEHNPAGECEEPLFQVLDGHAYPMKAAGECGATFEIIGSFVYAGRGGPWFVIVESTR